MSNEAKHTWTQHRENLWTYGPGRVVKAGALYFASSSAYLPPRPLGMHDTLMSAKAAVERVHA